MSLANPFSILRARSLGVSTLGPPDRRLIVAVEIRNPGSVACVFLSSWIEAHFQPGDAVVEGALMRQLHAQAREAFLPPNGELHCELRLPISIGLLEAVERTRSDGVTVEISSRVLVAPVIGVSESPRLGLPWEAGIFDPPGSRFSVSVPKSDWIKYLAQWQWERVELFELPFDVPREGPAFRRAFELLRTAEQRYRQGDYVGTFQSCWQALESLALDAATSESKKAAYTRLLEMRLQGEEKRRRMNELLLALNSIGHLGRHEERPLEDLTRQDALFILRTSLATIGYLAGQ